MITRSLARSACVALTVPLVGFLLGCGDTESVSDASTPNLQQDQTTAGSLPADHGKNHKEKLAEADRLLSEATRLLDAKEAEVATLQNRIGVLERELQKAKQQQQQQLAAARESLAETERTGQFLKQSLRASQIRFGMMTNEEQEPAIAAMDQARTRGAESLTGYQINLLYRVGTLDALRYCEAAESFEVSDSAPFKQGDQ